jgi:hypothetical protein
LLSTFAPKLASAIKHGIDAGELDFDIEADNLWERMYPEISKAVGGFVGEMMARSEAQIMRLTLIYALLDEASAMRVEHLEGAIALWDYCKASVRFVFGNLSGDAQKIMDVLVAYPDGISRTDLHIALKKNLYGERLRLATEELIGLELLKDKKKESGGRPTTIYTANNPT